jgi:hypothetical protein
MNVDLTPEQKAFARRAIESGRLHSEEDAVQEAAADHPATPAKARRKFHT